MNNIKIIIFLILFSTACFGQETTKVINSIETTLELGLGGANYGVQVKANHDWLEENRITLSSSLSYSTFWGPINNYTQYYPSLSALTDISGFTTDNHLRLYSGLEFAFFKKRNFSLSIEGYLGGYNAYMNGNYFHERLQVEQDYSASQFFFDYGTRLGMCYYVNSKFGIQGTLNNSLRQLGYGYKLLPTIYQYNPDNKMSLGFGIVWRLD